MERALRSLGRIDAAIEIQLALEKEMENVPNKDGYTYEELDELYLHLSRAELSKKYFALAYAEL